ncbi:MAG: EamA family transporter [Candidatus Binatia bacterium]
MLPQLVALIASIFFAGNFITARRGLQYSNSITVTLVAQIVHTVALWPVVFLTEGIPDVEPVAILLFIVVGILMAVIRLLSFTGVEKIGAARAGALRSTFPLFSVLVAIAFLGEEASIPILGGTALIVMGIILTSWQPTIRPPSFRWWHVSVSLIAALLAGVVHPIRRYALELSNYPVFLAALVGIVSLFTLSGWLAFQSTTQRPIWNRRAIKSFIVAGLFQTIGFLLINIALSIGPVVHVIPIVAAFPLWVLLGTRILLRDIERIGIRTVIGTFMVVAGTTAVLIG